MTALLKLQHTHKISQLVLFLGVATTLFVVSQNCSAEENFSVVENKDTIKITRGSNPVLTYHKTDVEPPKGADPLYRRSGFIHPLHSPKGAELTGIHPDDHYHHLGLWHAWVKCVINGEEIDFWNLKKGKGRVRYAKTIKLIEDDNRAGFVVQQEHVAFLGKKNAETVILRETFKVVASLKENTYLIDYETVQENVSKFTLELPAYRYGGPIAYRAPHHWDKNNSDYLSSKGKTRIDGHETRSEWCSFSGVVPKGEGVVSLAILGHPKNHDAPQRMRVWPPKSNNGAIFFNYVPIQENSWAIEPGKKSIMRYRLVATDSKPDPKALNALWENYSK